MVPVMRRALLAGLVVAIGVPAQARADGTIRAEPSNRYATTDVTIGAGEAVTFQNSDVVAHDVTSKQTKAGGKRLFASEITDGGENGEVKGVPDLQPGQYDFFCSLHSSMKGKLTVTGEPGVTPSPTVAPTPEPDTKRPEVTIAGTLRARAIRRHRRIGLTIRANEAVKLTLVARIGKHRLGRVALRVSSGSRRVGIRLAHKRAVRKGRRLRILAIAVDKAGNRRRSRLVVKLP
jgi:plastocyanin